ncbi:MAG TPA: dihydrofolate reductase family protein [Thermoanaerobaculia bacterium]|jgi:riboflavin-specific deaminase-like protein
MSVSILTASSLNGIITPERGAAGESLIPLVGVPPEVMEWKREVRRRHDAVLVGTGTVLVDDPGLVSHALPGRPAVRVTLDPEGRIPRRARFFDGAARTVVGVSQATPREYLEFLAERKVEAVIAGERRVDLRRFLAALTERGLADVVAEGGGTLNRALLAEGLVDRLYLMLIPAVLDAGSVNLFEGGGVVARFRLEGVERMGDYVVMEYAAVRENRPVGAKFE